VSFNSSLSSSYTVYIDTSYTISLVDRSFLLKVLITVLREAILAVKVRRVEGLIDSKEYIIINFYLKGSTKGKPVIAYFRRSVRIVDDLGDINILVGVNILRLEEITPNIRRKVLEVGLY
jgi:hypothetical protein